MVAYTPFLVADRPASLRIIRGAGIDNLDGQIGIMSNANATPNVKSFVREFPSSDGFYDTFDESLYVNDDGTLTNLGQRIRDNTVRIADSGVFNKDGAEFDGYDQLFQEYERMDIDYGIILDVLNDAEATHDSAQRAMEVLDKSDRGFELVGVAQGTSLNEYLESYEDLKSLGYNHIAIGGLLSKHGERTGAFAHVDNEEFMRKVLRAIRETYPEDWIFALGCHHPKRHSFFEELGLFGSDYKGWIYKYQPRDDLDKKPARKWRYHGVRSFINSNLLRNSFEDGADRLLITSCSKRKRDLGGRAPAIDVYDGAYYRTLKKWERENEQNEDELDSLILSAKYGLIPPEYKIELYDERLDSSPDEDFREEVAVDVKNYLRYRNYDEILVVAGNHYREALMDPLVEYSEDDTVIRVADGKLGKKLQTMKQWLGEFQNA